MSKSQKYRRWIIGLLIFYLAGATLLYFFQESLLFHPNKIEASEHYHFTIPFHEEIIRYNQDVQIAGIDFPVQQGVKKGTIVFYHGNRDNCEHYEPYAKFLTDAGYEVWMIDYPGFGKSTGDISEKILYRDAVLFFDRATSGISRDSIIIYGKSIGTGMASYVAGKRNARKLILETPYYSIDRLSRHFFPIYPVSWLLHYHMSNAENLQKVSAPVVLFHGSSDGIIPYDQSLELQQDADAQAHPLKLVAIEGGSHNDLLEFKTFREKLLAELKP